MKVDFGLPTDGAVHRICLQCHYDGVTRHTREGRIVYRCPSCGHEDGRALYWGGGEEWVAQDGELWHDVSATLVRDHQGRILLYERTEFPYGVLTIPAGHIDKGEEPEHAAARELQEEVGIHVTVLDHAITFDLLNEPCSGGADAHRWHVYTTVVDSTQSVHVIADEGRKPVWLTPSEAAQKQLLGPVRRLLEVLDLDSVPVVPDAAALHPVL